jgi:iron complex outermembrane recepter protein
LFLAGVAPAVSPRFPLILNIALNVVNHPNAKSVALLGTLLAALTSSAAQAGRDAPASEAEIVTLADFVVAAQADGTSRGYLERESALAGFVGISLQDTPFSVRVLPAELLAAQGTSTIGGLDRLDASVTASSSNAGWYSSPSVRGFNLHNWSNFRYNGLMLVNQQATGLENMARVELLKGLSALQAGFAAPGGLINYVTKRPTARPLQDLHLTLTSYGNAKAHFDVSRRFAQDRVGVRVNAAVEEERSFVREIEGDRQFVAIAADWQLSSATLLQIDTQYERRDQIAQPDMIGRADGSLPSDFNPRTFLGQTWATYPTEFTLIGARLTHRVSGAWGVVAEANWMKLQRDQNGFSLAELQRSGEADVYLYYSPDQTREPRTAQIRLEGGFATGPITHALVLGADAHRHDASWSEGFWGLVGTTNVYRPRVIADPTPTVPPSGLAMRVEDEGLFVHDVLSFDGPWTVHLGGRYARRDQTSYNPTSGARTRRYQDDAFAPTAAIVFKPGSALATYLSYAEGLEQGGTAPAGTVNQREQLKPLASGQLETGVKAELGALLAEAAVFQIDRPAEYVSATNTFVQDGNRRHRGVEVSLGGRLHREWTLFGSAMLLDAELEETGDPATQGKRPGGVPNRRVSLVGEYAPEALRGWTFTAAWTHTGARPLNDTNTNDFAPAYDVLSAGVRWQGRLGEVPFALRLTVDNVLDERYWADARWGSLVPGAPRTASAAARLEF